MVNDFIDGALAGASSLNMDGLANHTSNLASSISSEMSEIGFSSVTVANDFSFSSYNATTAAAAETHHYEESFDATYVPIIHEHSTDYHADSATASGTASTDSSASTTTATTEAASSESGNY
jgi:hypothetical protein